MELDTIYTTLILEASNNKKNFRELPNPDISELGHNPSCGDELTLMLKMDGDILADISFIGEGCAISKASTSLMIDILKGKSKENALSIIRSYISMIRGETLSSEAFKNLRDARVFENIKNLPARVKCATLSWHTLENILKKL